MSHVLLVPSVFFIIVTTMMKILQVNIKLDLCCTIKVIGVKKNRFPDMNFYDYYFQLLSVS